MNRCFRLLALVVALQAAACNKKTTTQQVPEQTEIVPAALVSVPVLNESPTKVKLEIAEELIPDLTYQTFSQYDVLGELFNGSSPEWPTSRRIMVRFPTLTVEQFNAIRKMYGNSSNIKFVPGREFSISDFLPPLMQVTIGKNLESNRLFSNCWGSLYEFQRRASDRFYVFSSDADEISETLSDSNFSSDVVTFSSADQPENTSAKIQIFDALLVYAKNYEKPSLLHAATFIDKNLVFEKTSSGLPYRLNTLEQIKKDYPNSIFSVRRYNNISKPLPDPSIHFRMPGRVFGAVDLSEDTDGRSIAKEQKK